MENLVKIWFPLPKSDWHKVSCESMWAKSLDNWDFQIENSPMHAYGVSYLDIIKASLWEDGLLFFRSISEKSRHSTYRIISLDHRYDNIFKKYWESIGTLWCTFESNTEKWLFSVDVPPETNIEKVYELLNKWEKDGIWNFEESDYWRK